METNTREIIKAYCDQKYPDNPERHSRIYNSLARDELFEKEQELQKSFFEFSLEEAQEYLLNLTVANKYKSVRKSISPSYLAQLISFYRDLVNFEMKVSGHYHENVLADKKIRFAISALSDDDLPIFTKETLEQACEALDSGFDKARADHTKLMLWLFYSGCTTFDEIMAIKEEDIDFDRRTILIRDDKRRNDRTIHLKDECYKLLIHHHDERFYSNYRMTNILVPYHDSYIWFPYRMAKAPANSSDEELVRYFTEINNQRNPDRIVDLLCKNIGWIRKEHNIQITFDVLYYRGIYDYMIDEIGEERSEEILSLEGMENDSDSFWTLYHLIQDYGAKCNDRYEVYRIKYNMAKYFIK